MAGTFTSLSAYSYQGGTALLTRADRASLCRWPARLQVCAKQAKDHTCRPTQQQADITLHARCSK